METPSKPNMKGNGGEISQDNTKVSDSKKQVAQAGGQLTAGEEKGGNNTNK